MMSNTSVAPADRPTERLLSEHAGAWRRATRHPFLAAVREGTLPEEAFRIWLEQDYAFAWALLRFQAHLLARAPRRAQRVLAGGLVALEAELTWFEQRARRRGLALQAALLPATAAYTGFLEQRGRHSYAEGIVALWALERAYLEAWRSASPGHRAYREYVEHWTVPAFAAYVEELAIAADAALDEPQASRGLAEVFLSVASLERDFWEMAWSRRCAADGGGAR